MNREGQNMRDSEQIYNSKYSIYFSITTLTKYALIIRNVFFSPYGILSLCLFEIKDLFTFS